MIKDKLKKILSVEGIFVILLFILFCYLFVENFVFSESYEMGLLRYMDDYNFNVRLNEWQTSLKEHNFQQIFCFNQYAYGWIFWALHGIITFPFYISGMEQMVISTLRNLSLIMSFATLYFIYKILGYYTKRNIYKILAILCIIFSHEFILYSLTFDTTAMIRFFGIVAIYYVVRDKDLSIKTIVFSALCLGVSVATKIIGAVFIPIVFLLLFDRLRNNELKDKFKKIVLWSFIIICSIIFLTNPGIIIFAGKSGTMQPYNDYLFNTLINGVIIHFPNDYNGYFEQITACFYGRVVAII